MPSSGLWFFVVGVWCSVISFGFFFDFPERKVFTSFGLLILLWDCNQSSVSYFICFTILMGFIYVFLRAFRSIGR